MHESGLSKKSGLFWNFNMTGHGTCWKECKEPQLNHTGSWIAERIFYPLATGTSIGDPFRIFETWYDYGIVVPYFLSNPLKHITVEPKKINQSSIKRHFLVGLAVCLLHQNQLWWVPTIFRRRVLDKIQDILEVTLVWILVRGELGASLILLHLGLNVNITYIGNNMIMQGGKMFLLVIWQFFIASNH